MKKYTISVPDNTPEVDNLLSFTNDYLKTNFGAKIDVSTG